VHKPGPWSQGPVFLQQLALLDGVDLASTQRGGADHMHTVVEAAKLAFADREAWYGDPDHVDVPLKTLLDKRYNDERRTLIGSRASGDLRPARPTAAGLDPARRPGPADAEAGLAGAVGRRHSGGGPAHRGQRRHVLHHGDRRGRQHGGGDAERRLAEELAGGAGPGFPLGTRGQMAWLVDGHNNSLAPGKRPRTTLSPTLVLKDGRAHLAFGTPGGDQQDQWTLNFFLNHVEFGLGPQAATEALTFHTDHVPTSFTPRRSRPLALVVERGADPHVLDELRRRGHEIDVVDAHSLGKVCATGLGADGFVLAAASPRGEQAYAVAG